MGRVRRRWRRRHRRSRRWPRCLGSGSSFSRRIKTARCRCTLSSQCYDHHAMMLRNESSTVCLETTTVYCTTGAPALRLRGRVSDVQRQAGRRTQPPNPHAHARTYARTHARTHASGHRRTRTGSCCASWPALGATFSAAASAPSTVQSLRVSRAQVDRCSCACGRMTGDSDSEGARLGSTTVKARQQVRLP